MLLSNERYYTYDYKSRQYQKLRYHEDFTCDLFLYRFTFVSLSLEKYRDFEFCVHTYIECSYCTRKNISICFFFLYVK